MKKLLTILLVVFSSPLHALEPANNPNLAVVRIKSHGCSGTIIQTTNGKSWILSCCHMFFDNKDKIDQAKITKGLLIDGPNQPYAPRKVCPSRVVAADPDHDLSLLEIDNGPFNFIPVAPQGHRPGRNLSSAGYDEMKWPITIRGSTILSMRGDWTFTREKPWHGRSGGGLFDLDAKVLIGVVNGYEVTGQQRGIYISHESVLKFMAKAKMSNQSTPQTDIRVWDVTPGSPPRQIQPIFIPNKKAQPLCPT